MEECIFCKIVSGDIESARVYEDDDTVAFLDIHPINLGHTLVVPKKHFKNFYETPDETLGKTITVTKKISQAVKKAFGADGVNIHINNDPAAGQVIFHTHIHVIPRLEDDGYTHWRGKSYSSEEITKAGEKLRAAMEAR